MSWSSRDRGVGPRLIPIGTGLAALASFHAPECLAQPQVGLEIDAVVFGSDNPFLLPGDNWGSGAIDVAARPYLDWDLDPATRLELTGQAAFRQYFRLYGNFVTGFADAQLRHRHNEFLTVTAEANYSRDLMTDVLTDTIDTAFDTRGIRESVDARAAVAWSTNATTTITADGGWQHLSYPNSRILESTDAWDIGVGVRKQVSARTGLGAETRYTSSQPADGEESSVAEFNLTADHRFSEKWRGDIRAGAEWSNTGSLFGDDSNRVRFNGGINLCYEPEFTTACLNSSLGSEVSGLGGLQREFAMGANLRTRVSEHGTVTAGAEMRRTDITGTSASARVLRGDAGYEHRLSRTLYLTTGASYLERRVAGRTLNSFIVQLGISIRGERP